MLFLMAFLLSSSAFAQQTSDYPDTDRVLDLGGQQWVSGDCAALSLQPEFQRNIIKCKTLFSENYYWHGRMLSPDGFKKLVEDIRSAVRQRQEAWERAQKAARSYSFLSWLPLPKWGIFKEITSGAASPLLILVFIIGILFLICVGIHRYQMQIRETHGYELFDWVNLIIHTAIWIIFWLMVICGCFGQIIEPTEWDGCPAVSTIILTGLFLIPVCRTNKEINNWGESIVINLFQTIFGFLIGSFLMFLMIFSSGGKKKSA